MTIDDAIKMLKGEKKAGRNSVVLAYWTADCFDHKDNKDWDALSEAIEGNMDWSHVHDHIEDSIVFLERMDKAEGRDE